MRTQPWIMAIALCVSAARVDAGTCVNVSVVDDEYLMDLEGSKLGCTSAAWFPADQSTAPETLYSSKWEQSVESKSSASVKKYEGLPIVPVLKTRVAYNLTGLPVKAEAWARKCFEYAGETGVVHVKIDADRGDLFSYFGLSSAVHVRAALLLPGGKQEQDSVGIAQAVDEYLALYPNDPAVGSGTGTSICSDPNPEFCAMFDGGSGWIQTYELPEQPDVGGVFAAVELDATNMWLLGNVPTPVAEWGAVGQPFKTGDRFVLWMHVATVGHGGVNLWGENMISTAAQHVVRVDGDITGALKALPDAECALPIPPPDRDGSTRYDPSAPHDGDVSYDGTSIGAGSGEGDR